MNRKPLKSTERFLFWKKEIELLKEYRTRLISDVVTGQMDVRNVEVPEYTPEEDIAEEAPEEQEVEMDAD